MRSTLSPPPPTPKDTDEASGEAEIQGDRSGPPIKGGSRFVEGKLFSRLLILVGIALFAVVLIAPPVPMPVRQVYKFNVRKDATILKIEELSREGGALVGEALKEEKAASAPSVMFPTESLEPPKVKYKEAKGH